MIEGMVTAGIDCEPGVFITGKKHLRYYEYARTSTHHTHPHCMYTHAQTHIDTLRDARASTLTHAVARYPRTDKQSLSLSLSLSLTHTHTRDTDTHTHTHVTHTHNNACHCDLHKTTPLVRKKTSRKTLKTKRHFYFILFCFKHSNNNGTRRHTQHKACSCTHTRNSVTHTTMGRRL